MRTAYSGRAAAYEKKGEFVKAIADHRMVVLFYAIEVEILTKLETPDRGELLAEAAGAYRARGACLENLGQAEAAQADRKRAESLQAEALKLASQTRPRETLTSNKAREPAAGEIGLVNAWTEAVTVVVDRIPYRLQVGEQKTIPAPAGTVAYELQAGPYHQVMTLQAGKMYTIRSQAP